MSQPKRQQILIVGSGFSGLCLAIQLKKAGIEDFTLLEAGDALGGTWRDNRYPGAACDVPAMSYCFSFEQKTDWTRKWAGRDEILGYMEALAGKWELHEHIRFGKAASSACFDAETARWQVRTESGEDFEADVLVCGVGQLQRPRFPEIPGLDDFAGPIFHSARWDPEVKLRGGKVAVIGNAASAVQLVPEIAPEVEQLSIFQRSANWVIPRGDRAYAPWERRLLGSWPVWARLHRWWLWLQFELFLYPVIRGQRFFARRVREIALQHLRDQVEDVALREVLVPDYPVGGKRILLSDDYYPALGRPNVELVTQGIERLVGEGVVTRDGELHPADAVVLATGFHTTEFLVPMEVRGLGGRDLHECWSAGAEAYLGLAVSGFPNFFMMYGPNTNLGHNSILFMIECQARYILACIQRLRAGDIEYLDLRPEVMARYNAHVADELSKTAWAATGDSWYKQSDGKITNNWYGSTVGYWWKTRRPDLAAYHQVRRRERGPAAPSTQAPSTGGLPS